MALKRNVLVFHSGALGDFVLAWPLLLALGRMFPQSRVVCVTHAQKGALAEKVLRVEAADVEGGGWHALHSDPKALPPRAGKLLAEAHQVFSFVGAAADATWLGNVRRLNPETKVTALRQKPPDGFGGHVVEHLIEQLRAEQPPIASAVEQMVRSINARGLLTNRSAGGDIVVHPGSGSREKCWPLERFIELIRRLRAEGRTVRAIIGEVERERWPAADIERLRSTASSVRTPETYLELLDELTTASALVANDSGPAHLGAAVGVPTVSIFGPTDPAQWRPLGPRVEVLRARPLDALSVEQACGKIREVSTR